MDIDLETRPVRPAGFCVSSSRRLRPQKALQFTATGRLPEKRPLCWYQGNALCKIGGFFRMSNALRLPTVTALLLLTAGQVEAAGRLFECVIVDARKVSNDGKLTSSNFGDLIVRDYSKLYFDEVSGAFRWQGYRGGVAEYKVLQQSSYENDLVAVLDAGGGARYIHHVLRISAWAPGLPFYFIIDSNIYAGTCQVVG